MRLSLDPRTSALPAVKTLLAAALLSGCAGSAADTDFRRKVSATSVTASAAGTVSVTVDFRDPDPKSTGLAK